MWQAHPNHSNSHVIDSTILDQLTWEWTSIKAASQDPFQTISSNTSFYSVQPPAEAYVREVMTLSRLEKEFGAWRDFT
jgi:hypothetical protein